MGLSTAQKNIENAVKKIQHRTENTKGKRNNEDSRKCEAARRSSRKGPEKMKRRVLRKLLRKARGEQLVRCTLGATEEKDESH